MRANGIAGFLLLAAAIAGFFTVADDTRHIGELAGVGGIAVAGLTLLAGSVGRWPAAALPVRPVALGILAGIIIGAGLDNVLAGEALGMTAGMLAGYAIARRRRGRDASG